MKNTSPQYDAQRLQRASHAESDEPVHQPLPPERSKELPELPDPSDVGESA